VKRPASHPLNGLGLGGNEEEKETAFCEKQNN
jgi:hypothetical protein